MAYLAQLLDDVVVHKFELAPGDTTLGRRADNGIVIEDNAVSGVHAKVQLVPNTYFNEYLEAHIEDLDSTNGTYLNDQPLLGRQRLHHNDVVRIAWNRFKFVDESEQEMERTVHMLKTRGGH